MSGPSLVLGEPMVVPRDTRCNGKTFTFTLLCLLLGVGFTLLWTQASSEAQPMAIQEAAMPMTWQSAMTPRVAPSSPTGYIRSMLRTGARPSLPRPLATAAATAELPVANKKEAQEWIAAWEARGSAGGQSSATMAVADAKEMSQADLKEIFDMRKKLDIQLALFRVEALRAITAQGADVPQGTVGTLEAELIEWDNGMFSKEAALGTDYAVNKQLTNERTAKTMADLAAAAVEAAASDVERKKAMKAKLKADLAATQAANAQSRAVSAQKYEAAQAEMKSTAAKMRAEDKAKVQEAGAAVAWRAEDMPGVTGPMGFFDPLGFAANCPQGKMLFYREVELKHGRVSMLAALGILVGEQFHPLFGGNIDVPAYVAFQETPLQTFWPAVVAAIAIPELFSVFSFDPSKQWEIKTDRRPGDLKWDPLGLKPEDPAELDVMQTKELNNGRLAMIAAAGMIAQELATGTKIF